MKRTIVTLALALVVGLFGMMWGAAPGQAQACTNTGGSNYTCSTSDWGSFSFFDISSPNITIKSTARLGIIWNFDRAYLEIEEGAELRYNAGPQPALWSTEGWNNTIKNDGSVAGIGLGGNSNTVHNYGTIGEAAHENVKYAVSMLGAGSELYNHEGGTIRGTTAVVSDRLRRIENAGLIEGSLGLEIEGPAFPGQKTTIINTGTIQRTSPGGVVIRRRSTGEHHRDVHLENEGIITGQIEFHGEGDDYVENKAAGLIEGQVLLWGARGEMHNAGEITGNVHTRLGDDVITNAAGATIGGDAGLSHGTDVLTNAGTIGGTVLSGNGTATITNEGSGSIGAIRLGAGNDFVINETNAEILGDVALRGGNNTLTNDGTIGGDVTADDGTDKVTNAGAIAGFVNLGGGVAGTDTNTLDNSGTIGDGVIGGDIQNFITNEDGGEISGGITLGSADDEVENEDGATIDGDVNMGAGQDKVTNAGTISGGVYLGGGDTDDTNTVTNSGTIGQAFIGGGVTGGDIKNTVTNKKDAEIFGDVTLGNADDKVTNEKGATIDGDVSMGAGEDTVTNAGTISGVVNFGGSSVAGDTNTLDNSGSIGNGVTGGDITNIVKNLVTDDGAGTISGNITLGNANDEVENQAGATITDDVDMGAGTDKVTNAGTISGGVNLGGGAPADFNTLNNKGTIGRGVTGGHIQNIITNEDGGEISGGITLGSADDEVENKSGAKITGTVDLGDGNDTLDNYGRIDGDVRMGAGKDAVTNDGTITGVVNFGGSSVADDTNTLDNKGTIGRGVIGGDIRNIITNVDGGEISGDITLGSADDELTNEDGATIDADVALGDGDDTLDNFGNIEGIVTAGADTAKIDNEGFIGEIRLGGGDDTVTNTGSIGDNVNMGDGDNTLISSGDIGGNVVTGAGTDEVNIDGSVLGNVTGGSGVDVVTVGSDAEVLGNVRLGAGDDKLILQNWDGSQILGAMDGGEGTDRLILEGGKGTLLTSDIRNFENVTVRNEGEWTISGNIPTSGGFLTSTLAGLWLDGDRNTVTYAAGGQIAVEADDGTGIFVEGDDNTLTNAGTVDVDGKLATGIRVRGDENTLLNTVAGSITAEGDTATGVGILGDGNVFTNDGAVDVGETAARGLHVFGDGNKLSNTVDGSIAATGNEVAAVVLANNGNGFANNNEFTNEGRIEANGDEAFGVVVVGTGNTVTNTVDGSIEVEGKDVVGVHIQGADNTFDNAGTVEVHGTDEVAGVQVYSTDESDDANVITNTGTIRAESDSGEARGIVTTGEGKTQIHNELGALIEADIAIHAGGEGEYGITNDGTIRGDIVLGDGDHVVQNDGDIFGDIRLGDGNHDITNDGFLSGDIDLSESTGDHKVELVGGSLWDPGLIQLGEGDDVLTYSTVANDMTDQHTLDGGDGDDTLILVDDGYLNLYNIVNFETLELRDAGTWQFHRDVSFRDAVTADAGHLILGNAEEGGIEFGTGGLTIGSDARLSGTGTITGDVTIEGTIAPGHSFGTFDVNGNYTQAAGSTYEAEMAIDGRRDLIDATGTATIDGDTLLDITAEYGYYDPTDRWNVLKADGGVTGTYGSAEWDIDLLFLGPEATTEGENVYIDLVHAGPSFASVAGTPNQKAVAAALDAAEAAGVGDDVVNLVLPALHVDDARQAYDSLHGEIYAQHRWATLSSAQDFVDAANRGVNANGDTRSVWATAFKSMGTVDSQGEYMEAKHDHFGLALGWTAWANDAWGLGLLGGFGSSNVSLVDAASAGTASGYKVGAYAQYDNGFLGATAQVVAGQDRFDVNRNMQLLGNPLDDRAAKAEYDSSNMAVSLTGSLNYKVGDYDVQPTLGLNWFSVTRDKFTEKGAAGANLVVEADEYSIAQGALGVTINAPVAEGETYAPQFRIGYVTNFGEFESDFKAAFAAAGDVPFTIGGETPGDSGFVAGGSIVGETGKEGLTYELSYDGKFLGSATVHTFGGMLGYSF